MSQRANLIKNRGLVTSGSELSLPEGSLRQATNINIDENGVATPRRGFNDYGNATDEVTSKRIKQLIDYKNRLFRHFEDQIQFEDENGLFQDIAGSYTEVRSGYRTKHQETKGNLYFTTEEGIKRLSVKSENDLSSTSTVVIDQAGVPKAAYMEGEAVDSVGGFLPAQSKVAYRFLFGRKDSNNNLLLGSPSAREVISNTNDKVVTSEVIEITTNQNAGANSISNSDYLVISTLTTKYTYYFKIDATDVQPPYNNNTFGTNFVLVDISNFASDDNNISATLANTMSNTMSEYSIALNNNKVTLTSNEEGNIDDPVFSFNNNVENTPLYNGTTSYSISDTVSFNGLEYTCIQATTGIDNGSEDPSGTETDNLYWEYSSTHILDDGVDVYVSVQGNLEQGSAANCDLTLILPSNIDENYFVQVYRTAIISAVEGLDLDDIDPGDESNIVYEKAVTSTDIAAGELTFADTTPESFRASGAPLYTNEITGEGILQSNDPPPIALDMALFRSSVFYANTKSAHRVEFDMLSVDNYVSGDTRLIIGNSSITRYYTAIFDTDRDTSETPDTPEGGDFYLSPSVSVGQAIDQTARSLVKIINQDSQSPVNAFYLTGADDLPGQLLLEARDLSDDTLYVGVQEDSFADIGGEFTPEIGVSKEMSRLRGNTTNTIITLNGHGFTTGDNKFISFLSDGDVDAPPSFSGIYEVTVLDVNEFTIEIPLATSIDSGGANPFLVDNSAIFSPDLESDNLEIQNRLYYSKADEPEAVPIANYIDVGAKDEEIKRILALRDNLFVLKDDGIYIVSGTSAPNFSVRLLDNTRIIAPDSAAVLNNQIYCLTEQGITVVTDSGAGVISRGIENLVDDIANAKFDFVPDTFGIPYENDRAYILFMPTDDDDTSATQAYRYNIFERTWTRWEYQATCGLVMERDAKMYLGDGDRNYVAQERKNFDRTDHADREFTIQISADGVEETEIKISNTDDVKVSDVITQTQEVSINYFNNRLLRRMDTFDTGITPPASSTMQDSFGAVAGDDMSDQAQALNDYLYSLDPVNITDKTINTANLLISIETLVDELNAVPTITTLKDYKKPESVTYEAYITKIDAPNNLITVHAARPFLQDDITVYKHFTQTIEWNPQHFGDPSAVKQIREITILFDQNNFYDAVAKFGSDVDQALTEVPFQGKGIGYWGDMVWSNPNAYWGGEGNDIPFRTIVPRGKQKCRYITLVFEHSNAREEFRVLGVTGVIRPISSRGYK